MSQPYDSNQYRATVVRNIDADTIALSVDMGFDCTIRLTVRLFGINAPEIRTPEGKVAAEYVAQRLPPGTACILETIKTARRSTGGIWGSSGSRTARA